MGSERNPHPTGHRMVCDIEYDLDGAVADICDLAAAWLLPGYCGVGAGHRRGFALVQHSASEPQVALAGAIELVSAVGLTLGMFTRPVALLGSVYLLMSMLLGGHFQIGYVW